MGEMVSVFLYLLYFPSYDVINDVIMSDADCTPGREPRSVAASNNMANHQALHESHTMATNCLWFIDFRFFEPTRLLRLSGVLCWYFRKRQPNRNQIAVREVALQ